MVLSALKVIRSEPLPIAVSCAHVPSACMPPSNEIPVFSAIITSTPGSIVKSAVTDRYPLASVGLTLIGLSIRYHVVSSVMSAVTVLPCPSNGRVRYQTPSQVLEPAE